MAWSLAHQPYQQRGLRTRRGGLIIMAKSKTAKQTKQRAEEPFRSENHIIDLGELDYSRIIYINGKGIEIMAIVFDRDVSEPTINVNIPGPTGNVQTNLTLFDVFDMGG